MSATWRCEVIGCGATWTGPSYALSAVVRRHELHWHEVIAEAVAITQELELPTAPRDVVRCLCPVEFYDPDCPKHSWESCW